MQKSLLDHASFAVLSSPFARATAIRRSRVHPYSPQAPRHPESFTDAPGLMFIVTPVVSIGASRIVVDAFGRCDYTSR